MEGSSRSNNHGRKVLLIGPKIPPYGGMGLQAQALVRLLSSDGVFVVFFPSNLPFPKGLQFIDRIRGVRPFVRSALTWIMLWRQIPETDVVHVLAASWLYFFLVVGPAVFLGRVHRKRVIVNYRSGEGKEFFRRYGWLAAPLFRMASTVTAPSEFLAEAIRERFGVPVSVVPNIIDVSSFRYRDRRVFRPIMLVTRHLEKLYNVETAIRAFRDVQKRHPEATLYVAGTGSEEEHLRGLVVNWRLRNVHFLGHVPHRDLPSLYDRCDILLNSSLVDNFPGSLIEASASGLAVVSTNAGGIPFIYQNGTSAILVPVGDWRGLAAGVEQILESPSLGSMLTSQGLELCRQCTWVQVRRLLYRSYGFALSTEEATSVGGPGKEQTAALAKTGKSGPGFISK